mmetsp:Transcript_39820/g.124445  ORF Transcript_39820/g.124445 Transcript_39820/m.124445 type:complete len:300 (-) Transcript_39820:61-960(-)
MRFEQRMRAHTDGLVARRCTSGTITTERSSSSRLKAMFRKSRRTGALAASPSPRTPPMVPPSSPSSPVSRTKSQSTSNNRQSGSRRSLNAARTHRPLKSRIPTSRRSVRLMRSRRSLMLSVGSGGPWVRSRNSRGSSLSGCPTSCGWGTAPSAGESSRSSAGYMASGVPFGFTDASSIVPRESKLKAFPASARLPTSVAAASVASSRFSTRLPTARTRSTDMRRSSAHSRFTSRRISSSVNGGGRAACGPPRNRKFVGVSDSPICCGSSPPAEFLRRRLMSLKEAFSPSRRAVPRNPPA